MMQRFQFLLSMPFSSTAVFRRTMRSVTRLHLPRAQSTKICSSYLQTSRFSRQPKAAAVSESNRTLKPNAAQGSSFIRLFDEISQIVGSIKPNPEPEPEIAPAASAPDEEENSVSIVEDASPKLSSCTPGVCENATEVSIQETGPIINETLAIIFENDDSLLMEERLDRSSLRFNSFIVEKVLKRCSKKPNSAWRFFNWVKLKEGFSHTTETYRAMLQLAGEAKEFEVMEELMEEVECIEDVENWVVVISHYGKAKLVGKALAAFEKMKKRGFEPSVEVYSSLIDALCIAEKPDIAVEFYNETVQKEMILTEKNYTALMNCMARSGDASAVRSIADDMARLVRVDKGVVYGHVLKGFCIAGRITDALETIRSIKDQNLPILPLYYETLIKGLCRAGRVEDAREIIGIMEKTCPVNLNIYGMIIDGYLKNNDVSKALDLFSSMKEKGHVPRRSIYREVIQKLFKSKQFQKGKELFDEMVGKGIGPDDGLIMAMVSCYISQNEISEVCKMLRSMEQKGTKPAPRVFSVFINKLCKAGRTDDIVKVLHEMQASDGEVFQRVISYLEKKGEIENLDKVKQLLQNTSKIHTPNLSSEAELVPLLEDKLHHNTSPLIQDLDLSLTRNEEPSNVCSADEVGEISRILTSSSNWSSVEQSLEKLGTKFTPESVLEILCKCQLHGQSALSFFHWVGKQDGYRHTTETYNMAIKIAGGGKSFTHMRRLFYDMKRNNHEVTPHTWTILIMQYGRKGLTNIALEIFDEMKKSGITPIGSTYKFLITSLCGKKGRKVDKAVKLFQEMIRSEHVPDKDLIETYLVCLCEANRLKDAGKCLEYLSGVGFTKELRYSLYIRALCRSWRVEEAIKLMSEIGNGEEREKINAYVYGSIVHGLLRKGMLDAALTKVNEMREAGTEPTVHVYTSLIGGFFKEKKVDKAMEMFEKMKGEGCDPTVVTYSVVIHGYVISGMVDEAWKVFEEMKEKGPAPDFKTYEMFIRGLCGIGRSEDGLKLLSEMFSGGVPPSSVLFRTVQFGLNREGKGELARAVQQQKKELRKVRHFGE